MWVFFFSEEISLKSTNEYCTCTYIYHKIWANIKCRYTTHGSYETKKETNKFDASLDIENFIFIHLSDSKYGYQEQAYLTIVLSPQSSYHLEQVTYTKNIHRNPVPRGRANWPTHLLYQAALQRTVERDLGPSYVAKEQQPSWRPARVLLGDCWLNLTKNYTPEVWHSPSKMVVGKLLSYWEGDFSGVMLNFGRVDIWCENRVQTPKHWFTVDFMKVYCLAQVSKKYYYFPAVNDRV